MTPGTIELRTRDLDNFPPLGQKHPQHSYLVFTGYNDIQHIIAAHNVDGKLKVFYAPFNPRMPNTHLKADWSDDPAKYRSAIIFQGEVGEMFAIKSKIEKFGKEINLKGMDYKLPISTYILVGNIINNCNSFIASAIAKAGLEFVHPTYPDGTKVSMPGVTGNLGHTALDNIVGTISHANINERNLAEAQEKMELFMYQEMMRSKNMQAIGSNDFRESDIPHRDCGMSAMRQSDPFAGEVDPFTLPPFAERNSDTLSYQSDQYKWYASGPSNYQKPPSVYKYSEEHTVGQKGYTIDLPTVEINGRDDGHASFGVY